jgi:hypothetical protein
MEMILGVAQLINAHTKTRHELSKTVMSRQHGPGNKNHGGNTKNNWPTDSHDIPNIDPRNI